MESKEAHLLRELRRRRFSPEKLHDEVEKFLKEKGEKEISANNLIGYAVRHGFLLKDERSGMFYVDI